VALAYGAEHQKQNNTTTQQSQVNYINSVREKLNVRILR